MKYKEGGYRSAKYVPLMAVINNPKSSDEDRLKATHLN
jgi:hypothetical protein